MSILVFLEPDGNNVKQSAIEAVSFASHISSNITGLFFGKLTTKNKTQTGRAGANTVIEIETKKANTPVDYSTIISELITAKSFEKIIFSKSIFSDAIASHLAIKTNYPLINNVCEIPKNNQFKQLIFTGKAFADSNLKDANVIISIRKNTTFIRTDGIETPTMETYTPTSNFKRQYTISSVEKSSVDVSLTEADIVVSGGRGLKGPENWHLIEELAKLLGAATGCSKPVSDVGWRPHHEHVGQTGIKVSPSLYIAVGISGAIQHLAGVNSSKHILVINTDPEAPFFEKATYGVVGDAMKILPKVISILKN